jgi:L-amino acid N-acyltransferase YncA
MLIRTMTTDDWPSVRRIYLDGIATGQATFETAVPAWEQWHEGHLAAARIVAVDDDDVIGWAALSQISRRRAYAGVAELSIYVDESQRGRGIGKQLMLQLIRESEAAGIWTLQATVFPENEASVRLHQSCGFRVVGRRERIAQQYGRWRDTIMLERRSSIVGL